MMRTIANLASALALAVSQLAGSVPAMAQTPPSPTDSMGRPQVQPTRPSRPQVQPTRPTPVRPTPLPGPNRPGGGWGGNNGGNHGGNQGGGWNGGNNQGGNWNGATIRCESQNNRMRECRADTRGGVRLTRVHGGNCVQGRSWGYRSDVIWVNHGCRADFQTRNGYNGGGNNNGGGGPSAGAIIGGVAVAAGLVALLASNNNNSQPAPTGNAAPPLPTYVPPTGSSGAPARITASTGGVTPSARPSLNTCLTEAARQIGATGGTEIKLDRLDEIEQGNGGYRFRFQLHAVYPDETRTIPTFCRATPTAVVELTFG